MVDLALDVLLDSSLCWNGCRRLPEVLPCRKGAHDTVCMLDSADDVLHGLVEWVERV